jgi:hypothetical protein
MRVPVALVVLLPVPPAAAGVVSDVFLAAEVALRAPAVARTAAGGEGGGQHDDSQLCRSSMVTIWSSLTRSAVTLCSPHVEITDSAAAVRHVLSVCDAVGAAWGLTNVCCSQQMLLRRSQQHAAAHSALKSPGSVQMGGTSAALLRD